MDFRGEAGVLSESRNIVHKKAEVGVVPGVNFGIDSAIFFHVLWEMQHRRKNVYLGEN